MAWGSAAWRGGLTYLSPIHAADPINGGLLSLKAGRGVVGTVAVIVDRDLAREPEDTAMSIANPERPLLGSPHLDRTVLAPMAYVAKHRHHYVTWIQRHYEDISALRPVRRSADAIDPNVGTNFSFMKSREKNIVRAPPAGS